MDYRFWVVVATCLFLALSGCETIGDSGDDGPAGGANDKTCSGAEGDKAVAFDNPVGVSLPQNRTCLVTTYTKVLQAKNGEIVPAGMVIDSKGDVFFTGRTKGFHDTTYGDIFVAKMKPDGSLTWFKTYGGAKKDGFSKEGIYDPSQGTMAMIAIDDKDDLYIAGNYNGDDNGILLKMGADGAAKWAKSVEHKMPGKRQSFSAVSIHDGIAHVVGQRGVYAFKTSDGSSVGTYGIDVDKVAERTLAVKATAGGVYVGGWAGWSGNDDGFLLKATYADGKYTGVWEKRIPLSKGSKVSAIDIDADGALYVGVNHAGAHKLVVELQKWTTDGALTWARQYGGSQAARADVVKVVGKQIIVAGMSHMPGSATFSEPLGEGLLLLVEADGSLTKEHYYFSGTNPTSIDHVKGAAVHNGTLYVAFGHWKNSNFGEWRDPNDYGVLKHEWKTAPLSDYLLKDAEFKHEDLVFDVSEPAVKWEDVTAGVGQGDAATVKANRPPDTAATYFSAIPDYVKP